MARAIDANELLGIERLLDTDVVRQSKTASWLLNQVLHDIQAMPTLTPQNEPERAGLYGKYTVYKNKDGSLVTDCFILRPAKDPAAVAALRAYAAATDNAELSADIINWVGAEPNEPLSIEQLRQMDGEPVWVVPIGKCKWATRQWCVLAADEALIPGVDHWWWSFEGYGETWIAYRRPPEGEEDT